MCLRWLHNARKKHRPLPSPSLLGSRNVHDAPITAIIPKSIEYNRNGKELAFDPLFLRDSCTCARCIDPSTRQKVFDTAEIPFTVKVRHSKVQSDGSLGVTWDNDIPGYENHKSVYPSAFLLASSDLKSRITTTRNLFDRILWDRKTVGTQRDPVGFGSYMSSSATLYKALRHLQRYGLLFLSDVPSKPGSVEAIANRIGPLRHSLYGSTWDVRSVPSAKNVAYTSSNLGFHMDLLYCDIPPKVQLLHCMKASTTGGESLFSDTLHALAKMKHNDRLTDSLLTFPVTYHYKNDGHWYESTRSTVEPLPFPEGSLRHRSRDISNMYHIKAVNWSPPFQAPFLEDVEAPEFESGGAYSNLRTYLEAAKVFKALLEDEDVVLETKMESGTCVIFDNRRIVHARKAFDGTEGERWLRGAYVDEDAFKSRLRVLNEEFGVDEPVDPPQ